MKKKFSIQNYGLIILPSLFLIIYMGEYRLNSYWHNLLTLILYMILAITVLMLIKNVVNEIISKLESFTK